VTLQILTVFGTRSEAIKPAAVSRELQKRSHVTRYTLKAQPPNVQRPNAQRVTVRACAVAQHCRGERGREIVK